MKIDYPWTAISLMHLITTITIFSSDHVDFVTQISSKNASTQTYSTEATDRLWKALSNKNEDEALAALDAGADINASRLNHAVLHYAISKGCKFVFRRLLQCGASVKARAPDLESALWFAVINNRHHMMEELVTDYDAYVDEKKENSRRNDTILLYSFFDDTITNETRMKLVELGADVNAANAEGETPLHRAASFGNEVMFDFLLRHGASVKAINKDGHTILMSAALGRSNYIISKLIQNGCDVNAQRKDIGVTALWFAVSLGADRSNHDVVMTLLTAGADVDVRSRLCDESVEFLAERHCDVECLRAIQQKLAECRSKQSPF